MEREWGGKLAEAPGERRGSGKEWEEGLKLGRRGVDEFSVPTFSAHDKRVTPVFAWSEFRPAEMRERV